MRPPAPAATIRAHPRTVIDLGSAAVHAAETEPRAPLRHATLDRHEPGAAYDAAEAASIVRALRRRGLRCERLHLIAPKRSIQALPVDLPPPESEAPAEDIAACRVADMLEIEQGTFETAITTRAPGGAARRSSTVAACRHADAAALIEAFEQAGPRVAALVAPAAALIAAAYRAAPPAEPHHARVVVDVGWRDATTVAIRGGRPAFERHLRKLGFARVADQLEADVCGDAELAHWIARRGHRGHLPLAERAVGAIRPYGIDLVREIEATAVYFEELAGPDAVRDVLVAGGGAADPELMDWLDANLWLPTRRLADDLHADTTAPSPVPPDAAVAAGLAMSLGRGRPRGPRPARRPTAEGVPA